MPVPPQVIDQIKKDARRNNGRKYIALVIVCLMLAILHYLVFDVMVPKTAAFTIPQKWKMIPLRQTKETVHGYFGEPVADTKPGGSELWTGGSKGKMYYLRIYYVSDTIASAYSIHYRYKAWFGERDYMVDSSSIR
jgi:hypothetical protein